MIVAEKQRRPSQPERVRLPDRPARRSDRIELAPTAASGAAVREFIRASCRGHIEDSVMMDAELVATELVENAVRHGQTGCDVSVDLTDSGLLIAVRDGSRSLPRRVTRTSTQAGGRGLLLVERLSSAWGFELVDGGKIVWALLRDSDLRQADAASDT